MSLWWLLVVLVVWILVVALVVAPLAGPAALSYQAPIPIGALFDTHKDVVTRTGFMYAISTHNGQARRSGQGMIFHTELDDLDTDDSFKFASTMCQQMAGGIFAFYGRTSMASHQIAQAFSREFNMPFIAMSHAGSASKPDHPYTVSILPHVADAIADLIRHYGWSRLDYIYDSYEGLYQVQYIHTLLNNLSYSVDITYSWLDDVNHVHDELRRLDKQNTRSEKNFIIDLSTQNAYRVVLSQIPEVGMNRMGYNYLLATMDMATLDLQRFRHGGVNITGFQLINYSDPYVQEFVRAWSTVEPTVWPGAGNNKIELAAALSVDALEAFRRALDNMVKRQHNVFLSTFRRGVVYNRNLTQGIPCYTRPAIPWMHGPVMMLAFKEITFDGLTGHVNFDGRGYRKNYKLDIVTVSLDKGPHKTGEWHSERGLLQEMTVRRQRPVNNTRPRSVQVISSILTKPFLMVKKGPGPSGKPLTGNNRYEGYCKDLTDELQGYLRMDYVLKPVNDGEFGKELPNGTWTGVVGDLRRGEADMAVAPLTITADRERVIDFAKPFMNIAISMMIKRPEKQKPGVFAFMEPFSIPLWSCIVIAYVTVSVVVYLVSKFSPYEWSNRSYRYDRVVKYDFNLGNSFWFSMEALMLQGSDHCPRSVAGRVIGGAWWFFVLIVITSYTANLAAFLTVERMLHPIETADDLATQTEITYGLVDGGSTRKFFETSQVPTYQRMWNYMKTAQPPVFVKTVEEGVQRVRDSKGKYAFLIESSMNNYYNNRKPCDTARVGGDLNLEGFGIAMPHGSDLKEIITYATLKMKEDGTLHRLETKWWYEKGECGSNTGHRESNKRSLSLSNVAGVFYILITGLVLAIVLGLVEIYLNKRYSAKAQEQIMARTRTQTTIAETPPAEQINGLLEPYKILRHPR
ncbi:glutamate receptor 3-like [Littorina saxatilis]|uniref:glutamate receptor 3-like n=1 Tax=Littorina saxatilis TaxID=31220 RepID=UPI0038B65456